jgi:hypothetical protein
MCLLEGTRDALADLMLLEELCLELGETATLKLLHDADHSFRSGGERRGGQTGSAEAASDWIDARIS